MTITPRSGRHLIFASTKTRCKCNSTSRAEAESPGSADLTEVTVSLLLAPVLSAAIRSSFAAMMNTNFHSIRTHWPVA